MKVELFPFQRKAVNDLRMRVANALNSYHMTKVPQVVSLQAPTGSGKTIIMAALIEVSISGTERFSEQPDAISYGCLTLLRSMNSPSRKLT